MVWIYVTLGIGVIALVVLGWYVLRLYRKLIAVLAELTVVADNAGQALDLVAQIEVPEALDGRFDASFPTDRDSDDAWSGTDVRV